MRYKLINKNNPSYSTIETILTNRGIPYNEIKHYLNTTDEDINDYFLLGKDKLQLAAKELISAIQENKKVFMVIDPDADGYCSCAIFLNYLYKIYPEFVTNNITWWHHEGKQHGLQDCIEEALKYDLVICLDSASNDLIEHKQLKEKNIPVIIADHHEVDTISPNAIVINNQCSDYPNKDFCGGGITWQFCRFLDTLFETDYSNEFLDLVALSLCGDMMSRRSIETKHLMDKGFKDENIKNPFIYHMAKKNAYSLKGTITPIGAAFYIVPFINAVVRSGTQEEKELLFNSMLIFKAFDIIPSTKRGCKGQTEQLVEQAIRTVTNVKARQTREQDKAMQVLEERIEKDNMMNHKVLLFLLEQGEIAPGLAGLVANKIMAKYQRPCCILTRGVDESGNELFQGSARGYSKSGVNSFKEICEQSNVVQFAAGHANALGLGILEADVPAFLKYTDEILKDMQSEPLYYVDYIYENGKINFNDIMSIGSLSNLWGQDIDEPLIAIEGLKVYRELVSVYKKTDNTLKITSNSGVDLMKFKASKEDCEILAENAYSVINAVGRCNLNEWNGKITPQIFIEEMEIVNSCKYEF